MKKCPYRGVEDCVYLGGGDQYSGTCRGEKLEQPLCRYRPARYREGTTVRTTRGLTYHRVWYDRTAPAGSKKVRQMESRNRYGKERYPVMEEGESLQVIRTYHGEGEVYVMTQDRSGNLYAIHEGYLKEAPEKRPGAK